MFLYTSHETSLWCPIPCSLSPNGPLSKILPQGPFPRLLPKIPSWYPSLAPLPKIFPHNAPSSNPQALLIKIQPNWLCCLEPKIIRQRKRPPGQGMRPRKLPHQDLRHLEVRGGATTVSLGKVIDLLTKDCGDTRHGICLCDWRLLE
jgi:hypothetical protein